jgi:hypothetical protein
MVQLQIFINYVKPLACIQVCTKEHVQGLFLVKEQRPLKLITAVNEAGIPLTY